MLRFAKVRFSKLHAAFRATGCALLIALSATAAHADSNTAAAVPAVPDQCGGKNMLTDFAKTDPALFKKVEDEAAKTTNTEAILWKVEKDGAAPSYLFGTIHMPDTRVAKIPDAARDALKNASTVALEVIDLTDASMLAAVGKMPELLAYLDGTTLQGQLTPEEYDKVVKLVGKMGMPPQAAIVLRPWLVTMFLAMSDCQRSQMAAGKKTLDSTIEDSAKTNGTPVVGLETIESQLKSMASVPDAQQVQMLKSGLAYADRTDDLSETVLQLYLTRKLGAALPFQKALAEKTGISASAFDGFITNLLVDRNAKMVDKAKPLLDAGNAFIAIGALHLPGDSGLVTLLRNAGYKVTAIE